MVVERTRIGMRDHDRLGGKIDRFLGRAFTGVGEIDRHAEMVHLADADAPELRETGIRRL
jgi:hypothetical protein